MPKSYFIKTFGCQANVADSEKISATLEKQGFTQAKKLAKADLLVINTCSVRKSAEDRVLGLINNLTKSGSKQKVIVTGCILYHPKSWLKEKLSRVDQFVKTGQLIGSRAEQKRAEQKHAWIPIMEGCTNYCTYCVVPFARGKEKSRPIVDIYCEVEKLAKRGFEQITLLGQNVNSYHKNYKFQISNYKLKAKINKLQKKYKNKFALLLALLHGIKAIKKISFITSNPWDFDEGIIKTLALKKIDRKLHLPVQSGDDKILKKMNRRYTAKQYLLLLKKIRKEVPDIMIGTDIIVGFPGETKAQFLKTVKLCRQAKFSYAYINKYSPRPGTAAYRLKDDVPILEKKLRWKILDQLVNKDAKRNRLA